jgi:hypothetical protein
MDMKLHLNSTALSSHISVNVTNYINTKVSKGSFRDDLECMCFMYT